MNRFAPKQRTKADRERDLVMFCATARIGAVRAACADELAARYGVDRRFAEYHHTIALQKRVGEV